MTVRVGLVIPVLNNFDQAIDLVYSAKAPSIDLSIYIQPQYRYQVPLAKAWNRGIKDAVKDACDYIIVSNDDVMFAPQTIEQAVQWMENDTNIDLLGFTNVIDTFSDPFEIVFAEEDQVFIPHDIPSANGIYSDDMFSLFMIRSTFFDKFGTFDENFDPAWWEDTDMLYRIKLLGGNVFQSPIPYVHLMHQSTKKLTIPANSVKSGEYYIKKWGSAKKDLKETYANPYNDANLSPKEWRSL
jgi:GT2 family glycosyltransferase